MLVVNNTWERALWADALYACDGAWWRRYEAATAGQFTGQRWTQDKGAADKYGLRWIRSKAGYRLILDADAIGQGGNSGFQALNLALHFGARKIILTGFDMQPTAGALHWHGDHKRGDGLHNPTAQTFAGWRSAFENAAAQLADENVDVLNASRVSALSCFERVDLESVL